jgi:hypothetical protein
MASLKFRLPFICEISHFYEILFVKREGSLIFWKKIHPTNSHCDEKLGRDETLTWWHTTINRQCQYTTKFWQLMVMGERVANYSCLFLCVCVCVFFRCKLLCDNFICGKTMLNVWCLASYSSLQKESGGLQIGFGRHKWWNNWAISIGRVTKFCEKIVKHQTLCFF